MKRYVSLVSIVTLGLLATTASAAMTTVTDDFSVAHDYLTQGVAGTIWDGVMNGGAVTVANTTANAGVLTTTLSNAAGYGWYQGQADAPFLYKNVSASEDFTMQVAVAASSAGNYMVAGLMVYKDDNNFAGVNANYFSMRSVVLRSVDDGVAALDQFFGDGSTNVFPCYLKLNYVASTSTLLASFGNDGTTWTDSTPIVRMDLTGTLRVGITYSDYQAQVATAQFDNFSLTTGTVPEPSSLVLMTAGLFGLLAYAWRKRK